MPEDELRDPAYDSTGGKIRIMLIFNIIMMEKNCFSTE
jgi:hypothetical protein